MTEEEKENLNEIELEELQRKEAEEKLNKAYYSCFHSPEGQVVLKDMLAKFYKVTSLSESADLNFTLVNEGKRFVLLYILARMEAISGGPEDS